MMDVLGENKMDIKEAMIARHSVRAYDERPIEQDKIEALMREIADINAESGLNIQLVTDEPEAFSGFMAHYGKFAGVRNYIAMIGPKDREEDIGYYGERLVLLAQMMGLNTCWVALTFRRGKSKGKCNVGRGEKLHCTISLGYGITQGVQHRSRPMEDVCRTDREMPEWFRDGMSAALLAPTAINQQKFMIELERDTVSARATGGFYSKVDLGIVRYHFEIGAGKENFSWKN